MIKRKLFRKILDIFDQKYEFLIAEVCFLRKSDKEYSSLFLIWWARSVFHLILKLCLTPPKPGKFCSNLEIFFRSFFGFSCQIKLFLFAIFSFNQINFSSDYFFQSIIFKEKLQSFALYWLSSIPLFGTSLH